MVTDLDLCFLRSRDRRNARTSKNPVCAHAGGRRICTNKSEPRASTSRFELSEPVEGPYGPAASHPERRGTRDVGPRQRVTPATTGALGCGTRLAQRICWHTWGNTSAEPPHRPLRPSPAPVRKQVAGSRLGVSPALPARSRRFSIAITSGHSKCATCFFASGRYSADPASSTAYLVFQLRSCESTACRCHSAGAPPSRQGASHGRPKDL